MWKCMFTDTPLAAQGIRWLPWTSTLSNQPLTGINHNVLSLPIAPISLTFLPIYRPPTHTHTRLTLQSMGQVPMSISVGSHPATTASPLTSPLAFGISASPSIKWVTAVLTLLLRQQCMNPSEGSWTVLCRSRQCCRFTGLFLPPGLNFLSKSQATDG